MCLEFCHATGLPRITVSLLLSSSTRRTHQQNKNELSAKKEENIWNEANKRCWAKTFMKPLSAVLVPVGFNTTPTQIPSSATGWGYLSSTYCVRYVTTSRKYTQAKRHSSRCAHGIHAGTYLNPIHRKLAIDFAYSYCCTAVLLWQRLLRKVWFNS